MYVWDCKKIDDSAGNSLIKNVPNRVFGNKWSDTMDKEKKSVTVVLETGTSRFGNAFTERMA